MFVFLINFLCFFPSPFFFYYINIFVCVYFSIDCVVMFVFISSVFIYSVFFIYIILFNQSDALILF